MGSPEACPFRHHNFPVPSLQTLNIQCKVPNIKKNDKSLECIVLKVQNRSIQRNFLTKTKAHMSPMMNVDILNVGTFKIDLELHVTRVLL